jgi:hypothetical protein
VRSGRLAIKTVKTARSCCDRSRVIAATLGAMIVLTSGLAACSPGSDESPDGRTIIKRQRSMFEGLPGAKRGGEDFTSQGDPLASPTAQGDASIKDLLTTQGGKDTLVSKRPRHVMVHLAMRLNDGKEQLFLDQIVSDTTKRQFIGEGKTEQDIIDFLQTNYDDIMILFARMPAAELSPNVAFDRYSGGQYRIRITGAATKGLKFTELWLEQRAGAWKFVWVR